MNFGFGRKDDVDKKEEEEQKEEEVEEGGEGDYQRHRRRRQQQRRKEEKEQQHEEEEEEEVDEEGDERLDPRALARLKEQRRRRRRHQQRPNEEGEDQSDECQQPHERGDRSGVVVRVHCGESIQDALDNAAPGCTILLEAGTYYESIKSRVDGTKEQPITIKGPKSGPSAIIKGDDRSGSCVEINHDYHILDHFTIDGMIRDPRDREEVKECFRAKCLVIRGERPHRTLTGANGDHYVSAVDGCVVKNMKIYNCGGEGIRLRYFVTNTTIFHNRIMSTGCYDFKFEGDQGKKNGEGIYVGTSSKQWDHNVSGEPDICRFTRIYENYIDTHGNECVDVKEGTTNTVIETNYCTGQLDKDSGGIDSRADDTIIRYNKVVGCKGAGVRLGGHKVHNYQYGVNCQVYCNILEDNEFAGIKVMTEPHQIFQNKISGRGHKYKAFRGESADSFKGNSECPFDIDPPDQDIETTRWFQKCKP